MRKLLPTLALLATLLLPATARAGTHWVSPRHTWGPWQRYWITGYCYGTITASGTRARWGEVAVDPSVVRLGSYLQIRGIGANDVTFHAEDTGSAVLGRHIDVYTSCANAFQITGWHPARIAR